MIHFPKIFPVTSHTDFVGKGSTFVAIKGMQHKGTAFISLALDRGATTIVVEKQEMLDSSLEQRLHESSARLVRVDNARRALALLSAQALQFPARKLKIIAITGTKGKTSSAFMLEHILSKAGYKTALLSTVYNTIVGQQFSTNLTTRHPDYLHVFFDQCVNAGVEYVVLEAAAQAHSLDRLFGLEFDGFLFTNFDQEHAEFYASMDDYFQAKVSLMRQTKKDAPVVINADNVWCKKLLLDQSDHVSFGKTTQATYSFAPSKLGFDGGSCALMFDGATVEISMRLVGEFNCYNAVGVFALAHRLGVPVSIIQEGIATFERVPGRLERYALPNGAVSYIDYAHNPSSFYSVLSTLRALTGHLIVVCGSGGDRDKTKRPLMADVATRIADFVYFTTDNPRSEDPLSIIKEMIIGVAPENSHKYSVELDRELAIKKAYAMSSNKTIIALLGKGPDHYQLIGNIKVYFNEQEILQQLI